MNLRRASLLPLAAAMLLVSPLQAAQDERAAVAAYLSRNWQDVEVVVFERLGVREAPGEETRLPVGGDRRLPTEFWSIADAGDVAPGFGIDPQTQPAVDAFQLGTAVGQPGFENFQAPAAPEPAETEAPATAPVAATTDTAAVPPVAPPPPPTPEEVFRAAVADFESSLEANALGATPVAAHGLRAAAARLVSQGNTRILWHHRWTQPFGANLAALPVYVQAGYPVLGLKTLEGVLHVRGNDPFNVSARFWLHGPFQGMQPQPLAARVSGGTAESATPPDPFAVWHVLTESRSIRAGEVHYLDHPWFGILISISPVVLPPELMASYAAMKAAPAATAPAAPAPLPMR